MKSLQESLFDKDLIKKGNELGNLFVISDIDVYSNGDNEFKNKKNDIKKDILQIKLEELVNDKKYQARPRYEESTLTIALGENVADVVKPYISQSYKDIIKEVYLYDSNQKFKSAIDPRNFSGIFDDNLKSIYVRVIFKFDFGRYNDVIIELTKKY